ncbi:MAG TPA: hypothetical protein VG247_24715 [Pseudonocardiaceae bacterium]|jgi:hypothetical protein|nr:hypothetical protein [Pseudonocardiaceae bacterium]
MTRQGLIHGRRSAILAPLALLGVALCGVVGCGSQVSSASSPPPGQVAVAQPTLPDCPAAPPEKGKYPPASATTMVPATPNAARVCRYAGLNQSQPLHTLLKSGQVNSADLASLVGGLNSAVTWPVGRMSCPIDDSSSDLVIFGYPDGHTVDVTVGLKGCHMVSNGTDTKHLTTEPVYGQLAAVVGAPSGPGQPGS